MDNSIIMYSVGIFLVLFGFIFGMTKKKKVMNKNKWIFALPFLIFGFGLILFQSGTLAQFGFEPQTLAIGGEEIVEGGLDTSGAITGCDLGTKTTITLSAIDKYTSAGTSGTHRYRINGAPALEVSDTGTFTASPGDKLTILWENASTTGYFSDVSNVEVPCSGAKTFYTTLAQNGTLSSSIKDFDDDTVGSGNNVTLGAGDVKYATVKLSSAYQRDFPYGFVVTVEMNQTSMDDVILTQDGVELPSSTIPQSVSPTYSTESSRKAYLLGGIFSNEDVYIKVTLDADDSNNPQVSGGDVFLTFSPLNYFINEDNGGAFEGPSVEDEDNSLTRGAGTTVTIDID